MAIFRAEILAVQSPKSSMIAIRKCDLHVYINMIRL